MAYGLKYVLQYYQLGSDSYNYAQWLIYQTGFDAGNGPIYLEGNGPEPVSIELFESEGPIKPTSAVLNVINKVYGSPDWNELLASGSYDWYSVIGDGSDDLWICGTGGAINKYDYSAGTWATQTTPTANALITISSEATDKLISAGLSNTVIYSTNGGGTWTASTIGASSNRYFDSAIALDDSTVAAIAGDDGTSQPSLQRSTDSGANWTSYDGSVDTELSASQILGLALPDKDTLFITTNSGTLWKITSWSTTPSAASQVSGVDSVTRVDFYDANNGFCAGRISGTSGCYITTDGGTTWTLQVAPWTEASGIRGISYGSDGIMVVCTDDTVYYKHRNDTIWNTSAQPAATGDIQTTGNGVHYDPDISYIHLVTFTNGELCRIYVSDFLREFKSYSFLDYYVKFQRSTTKYQDGGGDQRGIWYPGFLDDEYGYTEDWAIPTGGILQLRATDGFNILKQTEYRTGAGALETGRKSMHAIICDALELIYSVLDITVYVETYATYLNDALGSDFTTSPSDATNPFTNSFVDAEYFMKSDRVPYTWWEVLEAILKSMDCTMLLPIINRGAAGPWIIANDRFYNTVDTDALDTLRYGTGTKAYSSKPANTYVRDINNSEGVFQGIYQIREKPYQFIEATIKDGRPLMLIKDGNFELEHWRDTSSLNNWVRTSLTIARTTTTNGNYSDYSCNITTTNAAFSTAGYIESIETSVPSGTRYLYLHFKYFMDVSSASPGSALQDNPAFYTSIRVGNEFGIEATAKPDTGYLEKSAFVWNVPPDIGWIAWSVPGAKMDTWVTETMIIPTDNWPNMVSGSFQIRFSEPRPGDYTINNFYIDEVYCFPVGDSFFREDIKIKAENTAITNGKRFDLGELHFYDLPKISFLDYSSAVRGYGAFRFPTILNRTNGDTVAFTLDGTGYTFTYQSSPGAVGTRDFDTETRFKQEVYYITNNYYVLTSGGGQPTVNIFPLIYDTTYDTGAPAFSDSADWDNISPNHSALVEPTTVVWTNHASITDDATPTAAADWRWHAVTQEAAGTEDTQIWKLRFERELARRGLNSQFIQGTYKKLAESENYFGALMGLLTNTNLETAVRNYRPISARSNNRLGQHEITMEKVHDETVTFTGEEVD